MSCSHHCTTHTQDFAKLPWELDMPHERAAAVLGSHLGVSGLQPGAVLDLGADQITGERLRVLVRKTTLRALGT
jgi:hypothetical protein